MNERDVILRERAAYLRGKSSNVCTSLHSGACRFCEEEVSKLYPLPKVTRPRVVRDKDGIEFRFVNGQIEDHWRHRWAAVGCWLMTVERVKLLADLIANPTETIDDV